jgi:hypothetical protein
MIVTVLLYAAVVGMAFIALVSFCVLVLCLVSLGMRALVDVENYETGDLAEVHRLPVRR